MTNSNILSDTALVESYLAGNHAAFGVIIQRYRERLYSYIFYLSGNRTLADDLFQETCFKAINSVLEGRYREQGKMLSWFIRIAHNLYMDHCRRRSTCPEKVVDASDTANQIHFQNNEPSHEDYVVLGQTHRQLRQLIQMLPEKQKEVVLMRYYGELTFKEIAVLTGVSINTSLGRMRYALMNLRKMMVRYRLEFSSIGW